MIPFRNQRFAIAMWFWVGVLRPFSGVAQDEDWDRTLDELVERGYNAVRIEAFPHLLAPPLHGPNPKEFRLPVEEPRFLAPWDPDFTLNFEPWPSLAAFIKKCYERKLYVALTTWLYDDSFTHRRNEIRERSDLVRMWDYTLRLLQKEGLLDRIIFVDLCNEAPFWMPSVLRRVSELAYPKPDPPADWNTQQRRFLEDTLNGAVGDLKQRWPNLLFTVSPGGHFNEYAQMDLGNFDLLENHMWLKQNEEFRNSINPKTSTLLNMNDDTDWYEVAQAISRSVDKQRAKWQRWMSEYIKWHKAWADRLQIPIAVTECWGPVSWRDHPALSWNWVKEWCAWCVQEAVNLDYWIIATSNFCTPRFPGMWEDMAWHQRMTNMILKGPVKN